MQRATTIQGILKVTKTTPLRGDSFDAFFVETDAARGYNAAGRLEDYFRANSDQPQKVLFMGHRGSGKSTELYRLSTLLTDEFEIIPFSILDEINIEDFTYVDLIFIVLNRLYEQAKVHDLSVDERILRNLHSYWHDEKILEELQISKAEVDASLQVSGGFWNLIRAQVQGILKTGYESKRTVRQFIEPKLSQLINSANDLILDISGQYTQQGKTPLLIIEDLDKLDIETAENLFLRHTNILTQFRIHIIYTFPIFLHYSEKYGTISEAFNHSEVLSMIKVRTKTGEPFNQGRGIIRTIIEHRLDPALLDENVMEFLIDRSGGSLRHVFEMLQNAALEARSTDRQATQIGGDAAQRAYQIMRSSFERRIERKHLPTLAALYDSADKKPMPDPMLKDMLSAMAVMEYNGDRWCGLHPAVEDIILEKRKVEGRSPACDA